MRLQDGELTIGIREMPMAKGDEGVGQLTAEDVEALGGSKQESAVDYIKRMLAESDAKIDAAEAEAKKAQVLGRVAVIAASCTGRGLKPIEVSEIAFAVHDAIEAEYERRKNG